MTGSKEKVQHQGNVGQGLTLLCRTVAEGCVECGLCQKNCLYLQKYGTPKQIAETVCATGAGIRSSFECSLCWLCTAVCPKDIDPAAMFFAMRLAARQQGQNVFKEHKPILAYEHWGVSPLFSWYGLPDRCDTVFFPGCAMAGTRSARVMQIYRHLRRTIPSLGMVLDCCTKPSHDLARKEYFQHMFGSLQRVLYDKGVRRVLVTCPSCYRVWRDYGGDIEVQTVYEELSRGGPLVMAAHPATVTVHDPCPTRYDAAIHKAVRDLLVAMGFSLAEMKHHGRTTLCCGEGGAACYIAPRMAGNWTETRAAEAGQHPIITYCAGCSNFLGRLAQAAHLTDIFFEPEKTMAGRIRVTRSPMTWLHRLLLKVRLRRVVRPRQSGRRKKDGGFVDRGDASGPPGKVPGNDQRRYRALCRMYEDLRRTFPGIDEIAPDQALELSGKEGVVFVDVRSREERAVSMVPGALDEKEFLENRSRCRGKTVIVYCTVGYRSGKFVLREGRGTPGLTNLRGGILAWLHAGGTVVQGGQATTKVHVYGEKWALQPCAYVPVVTKPS